MDFPLLPIFSLPLAILLVVLARNHAYQAGYKRGYNQCEIDRALDNLKDAVVKEPRKGEADG